MRIRIFYNFAIIVSKGVSMDIFTLAIWIGTLIFLALSFAKDRSENKASA